MEVKQMQKTKQIEAEYNLNDLLAVAMTFIVIGVGTAYGLQVMGEIKADMTPSSAEANATQDAIDGIAKIPEKLPTLATIIMAVVMLGAIVMLGMYAYKR